MVTLKDVFGQLVRDVRTEKLRTFLTVFGIVWGTVAISLMLAFGTGLHKQLIKSTAGLGDRIVIAWPGLTSIPYEGLGKGRRIRIADEDLESVRGSVPELRRISPEYSRSFRVSYATKTMSGRHALMSSMRISADSTIWTAKAVSTMSLLVRPKWSQRLAGSPMFSATLVVKATTS